MRPVLALAVGALAVIGCAELPDAPTRPARDAGADSDVPGLPDAGPPEVSFDPPSSPDAVARIVRVLLRFSVAPAVDSAMLVSGTLSSSQIRELTRGEPSNALVARSVPALRWLDAGDPTRLVVAPSRPLDAGAIYSIGVGSPPTAVTFTVATGDPLPLLARTWPPPDAEDASGAFAVLCGAAPLAVAPRALALDPGSRAGVLAGGVGAPFAVQSCVRWDASEASPDPSVPPPLLVLDGGASVRLDPAPLVGTGSAAVDPPLACADGELAFGLGCADVQDDRLVVRTPERPLLWAFDVGEGARTQTSASGWRFVLRPLAPASTASIDFATVDLLGRVEAATRSVETAAARPHVVLNEVYANSVGPEPAGEWVELVNDGAIDVDLAGWRIDDTGGPTELPSAVLAPGAFALVVNEAFVDDDGFDPVPAPGAVVVRVPKLGTNGLTDGEPLLLRDPGGAIVSRYPTSPKPKPGVSVIRIAPDAPDENAGSFVLDPSGKATPGAQNVP